MIVQICTATTDESRCDLHSRHSDPGYNWFNRTWHSGCILNNSTMIQSNLYDSIRVRNMYTVYIYIYMIHVGGIDSKLQLFNWDLVWTCLDIASIKTSADPLTFEVPTFRPNMSINSTPGSSLESQIEWQLEWISPPVTFIELDDGKIYRKPLYLMVKTMVSCRFSLNPIHRYFTCLYISAVSLESNEASAMS